MNAQEGEQLTAIGVDGCRGGWIAAQAFSTATGELTRSELRLLRVENGGLSPLVEECKRLAPRPPLAIDVPIGLPTTAGLRECDRQARVDLGRRWMCVFAAPDRELFRLSFEDAREIVLARRGENGTRSEYPIMSKQALAILPKIEEIDLLMRADLSRQDWIIEVHPEVSFRLLAKELGDEDSAAGLPRKQRTLGYVARLALLRRIFPDVADQVDAGHWRRSEVGRDDVLDAYVALWTARRYATDSANVVVLGGDKDDFGLFRRMVA